MKIRNVSLFFIGIIVLILGFFIVIFDYPQIKFFENMDSESYFLLDDDKKKIHQRLIIEFSIGIGISVLGVSLLILSFLKKIEKRFR